MRWVRRSKRWSRLAAVTLTAVVVLGVLGVTSSPAEAEAGAPGDVLSSARMTSFLLPFVPLPARSWRISYRSTTPTGDATTVTGTVLVPTSAWPGPGPRPVVGFAIGTKGMADRCATSRNLAIGTDYDSVFISGALARGWAVAVSDLPGLGTPGDHTYVVGQALGRAVLDSVRAAQRLPGTGLDPHGPVAIVGYSEGGNGSAWAAELQPTYAPELAVKGVATGAGPADLPKMFEFHDGGPFAFLILYAAIGFNAAYPELHLDSFLNATGQSAVRTYRDSCIIDAGITGLLSPKDIDAYVTSNPIDDPAWQARIRENNLGQRAPQVPALVAGSRLDEIIPYAQTTGLYQQWCSLGVDAHLTTYTFSEHLTGALYFFPDAYNFLADRLAGKPLARAQDCTAG